MRPLNEVLVKMTLKALKPIAWIKPSKVLAAANHFQRRESVDGVSGSEM
jgi:hypothetical protein